MTKIAATEEQLFRVAASPEKAYAFFSRPEMLRAAMVGVQRCEVLTEGRVRWVLEEKVDQGIRFQADYTVVYQGDGARHVSWRFIEGNMENEGSVWIEPVPSGGSEIRYHETVKPDLPITALMARLIKPLVARELRKDLHHFLVRAQQYLAN